MADSVLEQIAALKDEDWAVREEAAATLGTFRDARAVGPLVQLLGDDDRAVREATMLALTAIGEAAVLALGRCLEHASLTVQESAASILATIGDLRVVDALLGALSSPDWIVRMHAAKGLGRIADPRSVPPMMPLLQDKVKAVRVEAADALARIGQAAVPSLLDALQNKEWLVKLHAIEALGKMQSPDTVEPLLFVLFNDPDQAVRTDAVRALGDIGDGRAVDFLLTSLNDVEVRPMAVEALGKINELVGKGALKAPVVIGRDHLDGGSVASPYRETEAMRDTSDAIADWPILNALSNTASGASWVSFHHGGGVGMGYSLHAGQATVADGTPEAHAKIERVLTNDPALAILRHADAGYPEAEAAASQHHLPIPCSEPPH